MTQAPTRIALVEDDAELASWIEDYLRGQGMDVIHAARGDEAVSMIAEQQPDMVLLDIMLPGKDGHQVCREIRSFYQQPVLVLTANDEEIDEVVSLEIGADDFVAKPVRPRVLLARIKALLRRGQNSEKAGPSTTQTFGELTINAKSRQVKLGGEVISLSDAEFDLLLLLVENAGDIISRQQLVRRLRGLDYDGFDRTIDVRVSRLRKKLGDTGDTAVKIKTIWGKGYLFVPDAW